MSSINTLRELIKTGALGINPDTRVILGFEYSDDVHHYTGDYQDDVFRESGIVEMISEFLTTGVDKNMLNGKIKQAIQESDYIEREGYFVDDDGEEYDFEEACEKIGLAIDEDSDEDAIWEEASAQMTFIPDDISEAIIYDYYEFNLDTSLEQYDHKRGCFSITMNLETTAAELLETTYDFGNFQVTLDTSVAYLKLK